MRRSTGVFLAAFVLLTVRVSFCGSLITVGSGNIEKFHENFGLCTVIIGIIVGLGVLGAYLLIKEKNLATRQKNKLILNDMNDIYDNKGKKMLITENSINKKRLPPTNEVLKELLKKSGNRCNFDPCPNDIIDYKGFLKGHVISIMSNEKEQPNYNPNLSNEDGIKIDNLMLVCHEHYLDIKLHEKYTIDTLMIKKREAEESPNRNQTFEISDKIVEELIQEYVYGNL